MPINEKEDIDMLIQLVNSMKNSADELEMSYLKKDISGLEKTKKIILELKQRIDGIVK